MRKLHAVVIVILIVITTVNAALFPQLWRTRHLIQVAITRGTGFVQQPLTPLSTLKKEARSSTGRPRPRVALTREFCKNFELRDLILKKKLKCDVVMLPVVQHVSRLDNKTTCDSLIEEIAGAHVVVLTSPQAASAFVKVWPLVDHRKLHLNIASIGKKTSSVLAQHGIYANFTPSEESAACLSQELPQNFGKNVLFPASEIALNTIPDELRKRGFVVIRINTYTTEITDWNEDEERCASEVDIVTLASPSAARSWAKRAGTNFDAVVIGPTTHKTAVSLGFLSVTQGGRKIGCLDGMADGIRLLLDRKY